jgi:hypothetical protein
MELSKNKKYYPFMPGDYIHTDTGLVYKFINLVVPCPYFSNVHPSCVVCRTHRSALMLRCIALAKDDIYCSSKKGEMVWKKEKNLTEEMIESGRRPHVYDK